jgi:hypothetical protein
MCNEMVGGERPSKAAYNLCRQKGELMKTEQGEAEDEKAV